MQDLEKLLSEEENQEEGIKEEAQEEKEEVKEEPISIPEAEELTPEAKEAAKLLMDNPDLLRFIQEATEAYQNNLQTIPQYQTQQPTAFPTYTPPTMPQPQQPQPSQQPQQPRIDLQELEQKFWTKPIEATLELIQQLVLPQIQPIQQLYPLLATAVQNGLQNQVENFLTERLSSIGDEKMQEEIANEFLKVANQIQPTLLLDNNNLDYLYRIALGKVAEGKLTTKRKTPPPPMATEGSSNLPSAATSNSSALDELGSRIENMLKQQFNRGGGK